MAKYKDKKFRLKAVNSVFADGVSLRAFADPNGPDSLDGCSNAQVAWLKRYQSGGLRKIRLQEERQRAKGEHVFRLTPAAKAKARSAKVKAAAREVKAQMERKKSFRDEKTIYVSKTYDGPCTFDKTKYRTVTAPARADMVLVNSLSVASNISHVKNSLGRQVEVMDHCVVVARILGLRLVTEDYLAKTARQRMSEDYCIKYTPLAKKSRLALWVSPKLASRHPNVAALVQVATNMDGSKWTLLQSEGEFQAWQKAGRVKVCKLDQVADLHDLIRAAPQGVDKFRSGVGTFAVKPQVFRT